MAATTVIEIARFSQNLEIIMNNDMIQSADRLAALLDEQRACIERIIAILDK